MQLLEMSRNVLEAAAAAELDAVMATAPAQAGGLLPPQGVAVVMAEEAGSQLHAATGSAPWGSVEEEEEDVERMRRQVQQWEEGEVLDAEQRGRSGNGGGGRGGGGWG